MNPAMDDLEAEMEPTVDADVATDEFAAAQRQQAVMMKLVEQDANCVNPSAD